MSPIKILEKESTRLENTVRREEDRGMSAASSSVKEFTKAAIEAIVMLGYPIGRYLRSSQVPEHFAGGLPKIYARMRTSFYQNRNEFLRLKCLLQVRLEQQVRVEDLRIMARHAQKFAPQWTIKAHAEMAILELQKYL